MHPINQAALINQLRDFAAQDAVTQTEVEGFTKDLGYAKDGKQIINPRVIPVEVRTLERWGAWSAFDYYGDGRNLYQGSFGLDYRPMPHWLVGANARLGYVNRNAGLSLAQGGIYSAFYERDWWGVAGTLLGPNQYTLYGGAGYDFRLDNWLLGPVVNYQWDDVTVRQGFGLGQVSQVRAGGRIAYAAGKLQPELTVMWQGQYSNNDPLRRNAVWAGVGLNWFFTPSWSLFGGWAFEGNNSYQLNQATIGLRYGF